MSGDEGGGRERIRQERWAGWLDESEGRMLHVVVSTTEEPKTDLWKSAWVPPNADWNPKMLIIKII